MIVSGEPKGKAENFVFGSGARALTLRNYIVHLYDVRTATGRCSIRGGQSKEEQGWEENPHNNLRSWREIKREYGGVWTSASLQLRCSLLRENHAKPSYLPISGLRRSPGRKENLR